MRLSDLYGVRAVDAAGRTMGRVREVHAAGGEITYLLIGPLAFLARLTGGREGRRIPWSAVTKVHQDAIEVGRMAPSQPQSLAKIG